MGDIISNNNNKLEEETLEVAPEIAEKKEIH